MAKSDREGPSPLSTLALPTLTNDVINIDTASSDLPDDPETISQEIPGINEDDEPEEYRETQARVADQDAPSVVEGVPSDEDIEKALRGTKRPGPPGRNGKARKLSVPSADGKGEMEIKVPTPPYRLFKSDSMTRTQLTKVLWAWAWALPGWVKDRGMWYIYRDHPVLIDVTADDRKNGRFSNIDKVAVNGESPIMDDADLLNRYGAGSYKVVLNIEGEVATGYVVNLGGARWKDNPPNDKRVTDPREIDWTNPANASYKAYCRSVGIHPETLGDKGEDQAMATATTAITEMGRQNSELAGRLFTTLEKALENRNHTSEGDATGKALETMAQAAKAGNDVVMDAMRRMQEFQSEQGGKNTDPVAMMEMVAGLIEKLAPKADDSLKTELAEMRRELADARNQQMRDLQEEIRELRKNPVQAQQQGGLASLKETLETLREFRKMDEEMNPAKEAIEETAEELAPKWLRPILPIALPLLQGLAGMLLAPNRPGVPQMANPQPQQPSPFPQIQGPQPVQQQQQPMQQQRQPMQQPMQQQQQPPPPTDPFMPVISMIAPGLVNHLKEGKSGVEFAEWFMDGYGESGYDEIVANFPDTVILGKLYEHPGLGPQLQQQFPQEQVMEFVRQFMHHDEIVEPAAAAPVTVPPEGGAA